MEKNILKAWFHPYFDLFLTSNWMMDVALVVLLTCIIFVLWRVFALNIEKLTEKTKMEWDDALWFALWKPVNWMIAVIGLSMVGSVFADAVDSSLHELLPIIRKVLISSLIAWIFLRFINQIETRLIKQGRDATTISAVAKLVRAAVIIVVTLAILQTMGFSISGVLAFGGVGGLVVGMAAKDMLANFFGGLMIYLDRPFKVGNWIRSPDRQIEGTVEHIGWRQTRIRTFDKRPLYIPNSIFATIAVENPSRMTNRRIRETIGVRYCDSKQLTKIIAEVKSMLQQHPDIDTKQTLMVNLVSFGASSLDFFIYTFTKTTVWTEFHEIKQDVMLKIMAIIESHGADFAFPTQTLHIETEAGLEASPKTEA